MRTEQAPSALNLAHAGLGITLLPGNVVPPAFDGVLRRPDPPVQRMLAACTRVRPDPITAAFVQALCHDRLAAPARVAGPVVVEQGEVEAEPGRISPRVLVFEDPPCWRGPAARLKEMPCVVMKRLAPGGARSHRPVASRRCQSAGGGRPVPVRS